MTALQTQPVPARKCVAVWMFGCTLMVAAMVILGGLTRLTHSGLSMVDWQPLTFLPPLSEAEWQSVFAHYRMSPEFKQINPDMTLEGFKGIFWLEFLHRSWGRLIGLCFAAPLLLFVWKRWVERQLAWRLAGIFLLGGLQGLMGWLMVKSGLVDRPDVSHFRLAAHLLLALAILAALLWTALDLMPRGKTPRKAKALRPYVLGYLALVLTTACWGAFTAGLDAGLVYNSFPLMNGHWYPDEILAPHGGLAGFLNEPGLVQFTHRLLAVSTLLCALLLWLFGRKLGAGSLLPVLALWACVQASLGIATLLMQVPVALGSAHQAGAVVLFSLTVSLLHRLKHAGT